MTKITITQTTLDLANASKEAYEEATKLGTVEYVKFCCFEVTPEGVKIYFTVRR
jgi:hypothetical protein